MQLCLLDSKENSLTNIPIVNFTSINRVIPFSVKVFSTSGLTGVLSGANEGFLAG